MMVNNTPITDADASRLIYEASQIIGRTDRGEQMHQDANRKAVEISDFLGTWGDVLDNSGREFQVTALGQLVDALAERARQTLGAAQQSPLGAGVDSLAGDVAAGVKFGAPIVVIALIAVAAIVILK